MEYIETIVVASLLRCNGIMARHLALEKCDSKIGGVNVSVR